MKKKPTNRRGPKQSVSDEQLGQVLLWSHALGTLKASLKKHGIDRQAYYQAQRRAYSQGLVYDVEAIAKAKLGVDTVTLRLVTL